MIEFENVSFSYEGQEHGGLHGISLKIADGECVLFCGRSGCGKTTVTRLVNGLIPQFYQGELQGRVLVDGQEISNLPMYQIAAKVGSVFQNPRTQFFNTVTPTLGMTQKNQPQIKYTLDFDVTPHQLRHTYITNLLYAGVDPKTVQYLAGHENSKTTMDIYAKVKYNKPEELFGVVNGAFHQAIAE